MTELKNKISEVTVFRDGARVTRIGKIKLKAGPQKVIVPRITFQAREDSFRVKGKGKASLSSIDVITKQEVYKPDQDTTKLLEELEALLQDRKRVDDEIQTFNLKLSNIEQIMNEFTTTFGEVYAANEGDIEQMLSLDKHAEKTYKETQKKLQDLEGEAKQLDIDIQVLRDRIDKIRADRRINTYYDVEVSLEVSQESEIELEIAYQCTGASWSPNYEVDLVDDKAMLRRIAMVNNRTTEDWNDVDFTVSTALARPVTAVEGSPWYISVYDPEADMAKKREKGRRDRRMKMAAMPSRAPGGAAPPPAPKPVMKETFAEAEETVSGITVYHLPKPVTVLYDNDEHPVTLIEEKLDTKTIHYWYADKMAEVVAQDEVTNGDTVILAGPAKVLAKGEYVGETHLEQQSPREEFRLGTRTAYDLKAEKTLAIRNVEKAGVTRGKRKRNYTYRLKIENFSKRQIEIEIIDRIPHSNSTQISVKADMEKIAPDKHELGVMEWKKKIPAGEKMTLKYEYEVEWEKGVTVTPPLP